MDPRRYDPRRIVRGALDDDVTAAPEPPGVKLAAERPSRGDIPEDRLSDYASTLSPEA
jgi:hypothetical protein